MTRLVIEEYLGGFTVMDRKIPVWSEKPLLLIHLHFDNSRHCNSERKKWVIIKIIFRNHNQYDLVFNDMVGTECAEIMELKYKVN